MFEPEELDFIQKIMGIALVIIVIILIIYSIIFKLGMKNVNFPPITPNCPDYWESNENNKCINIHNLGQGCENNMDFNLDKYKGVAGKKQKCLWAKSCGIEWDGITNINIC